MTEFLNKIGINCDINNCSNYFENVELKNDILKDLESIGRKADFKGFEIIKKIYLSPEPFTSENDLTIACDNTPLPNISWSLRIAIAWNWHVGRK